MTPLPPDPEPDPPAAQSLMRTAPQAFAGILAHYGTMFTYDAGQRLSTFQYFLTAFAFLTAAFTTIVNVKSDMARLPQLAAPMVCAAAYLLAVLFGRLDKRNAQVIRLDQEPIRLLQAAIGAEFGDSPAWHSFRESAARAQIVTTYGVLIPGVYFVAAMIAAGGGWTTAVSAHGLPAPWALGGWAACAALAWVCLHIDLPLRSPRGA